MFRYRAFALVVTTIASSACGSFSDEGSGPAGGSSTTLTVFAASSLTPVFTRAIGPAFEDAHPGVKVLFNFAGSDTLAAQIRSEGGADVFASASGVWMDVVADDPGVTHRIDFALNRLVIITPDDDPAGVATIEDLASPGVQLALAAEGVPVGDYARQALGAAGVLEGAEGNIVSNEEDNASVVAKIAAGEADAGIVYVSDVSGPAGAAVRAVRIPDDLNVVATYPAAAIQGAGDPTLAAGFVDYLVGARAQATFATYGFIPAP